MKSIILSLLFFALVLVSKSQECVFYCPVNEGTVMETKHYNAKDKLQSTDKQTILKKEGSGNNISVTIKSESYDEKNKLVANRDLTYECKDGVFIFDMKNFLDPSVMDAYKDMQVSVTATNPDMPSVMVAGQSLKDGNLVMKVSNQGMTLMNMTVNITNRKVEAIEKITTPAGTFECYKISYEVDTKMMFSVKGKGIDWVSKNVGVVRSESYDAKGNLASYYVLSMLK